MNRDLEDRQSTFLASLLVVFVLFGTVSVSHAAENATAVYEEALEQNNAGFSCWLFGSNLSGYCD